MQKHSIHEFRDGDTIIRTETTTKTIPAVVDYDDIRAAVTIDPDNAHSPWDSCDGYDHTATPASKFGDEVNAEQMRGYFWADGHRERLVIQLTNPESWGNVGYYRASGASRQTSRELFAMECRRTIDQLQGWYNDYDTWFVKCDFLGESDSLGGCIGHDYASKEVANELADNVADMLELRGFTVTNRPEKPVTLRARGLSMTINQWREHFKRNLNSQNTMGRGTVKHR